MDTLSEVLESVRFRGQLYCRIEARAPWGMVADPARIATFHGVVRGQGVLRLAPDRTPVRVGPGDLVILCHGAQHSIADSASTPVTPIRAVLAGGARVVQCGGSGARSSLVCGAFVADAKTGPPLLSFLPPLLHVVASERTATVRSLLELLAAEADRDHGADASIARLTEALFVHAIRAWSEQHEDASSIWLGALRDPKIGAAVGLVHRRPDQDWTVRTLARAVGMSRSAFAERFATLVGMTPVRYVTSWRMYLASRELRETDHGVAEIAERVGYDSDASLTKAFKRAFGLAPGAYRRRGEPVTAA